jgi:hypothetical protein
LVEHHVCAADRIPLMVAIKKGLVVDVRLGGELAQQKPMIVR